MEREHRDAILSLARTEDWKTLMDYIGAAVNELQASLTFIDCKDETGISRTQGAVNALRNILLLEESALEVQSGNDGDEA